MHVDAKQPRANLRIRIVYGRNAKVIVHVPRHRPWMGKVSPKRSHVLGLRGW